MVALACLGVAAGCEVDDGDEDELGERADLVDGGAVEVLDGISVVTPPPGMRVAVEVIYEDGHMELIDVATDDEGRVGLHDLDQEWGLVAPAPAAAACPSECVDNRMSLTGWHWGGPLRWRYRDSGRPVGLSKMSALTAFKEGAAAGPSVQDGCGLADNVSAVQVYMGETNAAPGITVVGGAIICSAYDTQNVVGWTDLPDGVLGVACTWASIATGVAGGSDMLFDNVFGWYAARAPAGCSDQFSLRGVATHEFGHAYGLGHSPGDSCNLTMYPSTGPCNDGMRTYGLGDVLGLEAVY